jgi:DNA-binding beta-propeller fold protein YncE
LIVLNKSDATASFIDPTTGETFLQLPTGVGPHELAVSPDGSLAVVANYGGRSPPGNSLTVFDLRSFSVRSTIDLELNERPHGLQFVGGNEQLLVTIESRGRVIVVDVHLQARHLTVGRQRPVLVLIGVGLKHDRFGGLIRFHRVGFVRFFDDTCNILLAA